MTYFVGIDIAKYKHDCFICDHNGEVIRRSFTFSNNFNLILTNSTILCSYYYNNIIFTNYLSVVLLLSLITDLVLKNYYLPLILSIKAKK